MLSLRFQWSLPTETSSKQLVKRVCGPEERTRVGGRAQKATDKVKLWQDEAAEKEQVAEDQWLMHKQNNMRSIL